MPAAAQRSRRRSASGASRTAARRRRSGGAPAASATPLPHRAAHQASEVSPANARRAGQGPRAQAGDGPERQERALLSVTLSVVTFRPYPSPSGAHLYRGWSPTEGGGHINTGPAVVKRHVPCQGPAAPIQVRGLAEGRQAPGRLSAGRWAPLPASPPDPRATTSSMDWVRRQLEVRSFTSVTRHRAMSPSGSGGSGSSCSEGFSSSTRDGWGRPRG